MWRLRAVIMSHAVVHVAGGVRCDMHPPDPPGPSHPGHGFSVQPCNMNVSEQLWVLSPGRAACVKFPSTRLNTGYALGCSTPAALADGGWQVCKCL